MKSDLKPCPFCGGEVSLTYNSMDKAFSIWHRFNKCAMAEPMKLDEAESLADAAEKWNRRIPPAESEEQKAIKEQALSCAAELLKLVAMITKEEKKE